MATHVNTADLSSDKDELILLSVVKPQQKHV